MSDGSLAENEQVRRTAPLPRTGWNGPVRYIPVCPLIYKQQVTISLPAGIEGNATPLPVSPDSATAWISSTCTTATGCEARAAFQLCNGIRGIGIDRRGPSGLQRIKRFLVGGVPGACECETGSCRRIPQFKGQDVAGAGAERPRASFKRPSQRPPPRSPPGSTWSRPVSSRRRSVTSGPTCCLVLSVPPPR